MKSRRLMDLSRSRRSLPLKIALCITAFWPARLPQRLIHVIRAKRPACAAEMVKDRPHLHMRPCPAPRRANIAC
jgi:hypothetical protein